MLDLVPTPVTSTFHPSLLDGLPPAAQRWLRRAVPIGAPLHRAASLTMSGELLVSRWTRFTAVQDIVADGGFVWSPRIGGALTRITGADRYDRSGAEVDFRLLNVVPVARDSGPDVARSAAGRLAAETVAWIPQATVTMQWLPVDDSRAIVTVPTPTEPVQVEITVDPLGRLTSLWLRRWNTEDQPCGYVPFGGEFGPEFVTEDGVRIVGEGTVGWDYGTTRWERGQFFRFRITSARHLDGGRARFADIAA